MEQPRGWAGDRGMQQTLSGHSRTACPQQMWGAGQVPTAEGASCLGRFGKAESHGAEPNVTDLCSTSTPSLGLQHRSAHSHPACRPSLL